MAWVYVYTVQGLWRGNDHDGYCSGLDADDDDCSFSEEIDKEIKRERIALSLNDFESCHEGCTSEYGSGYCDGMFQEFIPLRVVSYTRKWNKYGDSYEDSDEDEDNHSDEDDEDEEEEKEECLEDISTEEREDDAVCNCRRCEERNKKHIEELNATRERPRRRNRYRQ